MVNAGRGADTYRRMNVETKSPLELVVMLYDGALRFVTDARDAIARKDVQARTEATRRALDIIVELQNTLNLEQGGDIARELDRLYSYMSTRLLDVTRGEPAAADELVTLLTTLREGWAKASTGAAAPTR